jgi:hypothetical protein
MLMVHKVNGFVSTHSIINMIHAADAIGPVPMTFTRLGKAGHKGLNETMQ